MSKKLVAPSILSSDFTNLTKDIEMVNKSDADYLHVDVMDGMFVPNISFGQNIVKSMSKLSEKPLDVHLMIEDPDRYIQEFRDAGATIITVHYEACKHLHRTIQLIKSTGARAGVALNPHTPTSVLQSIIADVDLVLIMSVNPGFGGQKFIPNAIEKVAEVKAMIKSSSSNSLIEIDGGVGLHNAQEIKDAGCDILVAGNAVFSSENPNNTISQLKA